MSFLLVVVGYYFMILPLFSIVFNGVENAAMSQVRSLVWLWDGTLGMYDLASVSGKYSDPWWCFCFFHVLFANVIVLNYLIAILGTTYEEMLEKTDFMFKSNRYRMIEKYSIAMNEKHGYGQFMLHPPMMNYLVLTIVPFIFCKKLMPKVSDVFSKIIFWIENLVYVIILLIGEIFLIPLIYLKHFLNILKAATILNAILLMTVWSIIGIFFLVYALFKDLHFYFKILCDYKELDEDEVQKNRDEEI